MSDYEFSENERQAIASVNLSFDEPMSKASENELKETFQRINTGTSTFDEEDARLLKLYQEAKAKEAKSI